MPWDDLQDEIAEEFDLADGRGARMEDRRDEARVAYHWLAVAKAKERRFFKNHPAWPIQLSNLHDEDKVEARLRWLAIGGHGPLPGRTVRIARLTGLEYSDIRRYNKQRRHAVAALDLCPKCEVAKPKSGRKKCETCLNKERKLSAEKIERRKAAGLCTQCGDKVEGKTWRCAGCAKKLSERRRKK
jgi:hypothetical protein